jgi:ABC-type polysaccharide/polyol phosphate export permease
METTGILGSLREEAGKLPAFFRRDLLVMWSYRLAFFADWLSLFGQVVLFYLIGRLVNPQILPAFGGEGTSYIEFVAVGIALASFLQVTLGRLSSAIREAQLAGTLESILVTPTAPTTWQLGSMVYDLAYVPIRTLLFLLLVSGIFAVDLSGSGLLPAGALLLAFIPFGWGLGMISAASVLTFRRGGGAISTLVFFLVVGSNSYFPIEVVPTWARPLVEVNPLTITLDAMRSTLLGGTGWEEVLPAMVKVIPLSAASIMVGMWAFGLALKRERRRGTLGLY